MHLFWEGKKKKISELEPAFCHLLPRETRVFAEKTDRLWVSQPRETDSGWPQRTEMNSAWSTEKREEALEWCKPGENKCFLCGGRRLWWGTPLYSRNGERNDL